MGATILSVFVGLWLMVSPAFLSMSQEAANNNHIAGPLAVTFSVISLWAINRNAIKVNVLIGAWLLLALFLLPYNKTPVLVSNAAAALALIFLALVKRKATQKFGGGWRSLFQHNPEHMQAAERDSFHAET